MLRVLVVLVLVAACAASSTATVRLPEVIRGSLTLTAAKSPYWVTQDTWIMAGATVTCEQNVLVKAKPGARLMVYGTLIAAKTTFRTAKPKPTLADRWGGIWFVGADCSASRLTEGCSIQAAGAPVQDPGLGSVSAAVVVWGDGQDVPKPELHSCQIAGSAGDGVLVIAAAPVLDQCTIARCTGRAVVFHGGGIADFAAPCVAAGNGANAAVFEGGGNGVFFPQQWRAPGFPYVVESVVSVLQGGSITIDPGVQLKMKTNAWLVADRGPITAPGLADKPITIAGATTGAGAWHGIVVNAGDTGSSFEYCEVTGGGVGGAADLSVTGGEVTVANCRFAKGAASGLWLQDCTAHVTGTTIEDHLSGVGIGILGSTRATISECLIRRNGLAGVHLNGRPSVTLTPHNALLHNGSYDVINNTPNTVDAQWNYWGVVSAKVVSRRIFDGRDARGLGVVIFDHFLTAPLGGGAAASVARLAIASAAAMPVRSGGVQVTYALTAPAVVQADIVNMAGRPIRRIAEEQEAAVGVNVLVWDGRSDAGLAVPAGRYLIRLQASGRSGERAQALAPVVIDQR